MPYQRPYIPAPPFRVDYFCPREGDYWQTPANGATRQNFQAAAALANVLRPPLGQARVVDGRGVVVYQIP